MTGGANGVTNRETDGETGGGVRLQYMPRAAYGVVYIDNDGAAGVDVGGDEEPEARKVAKEARTDAWKEY